jgi:hypothetical protein
MLQGYKQGDEIQEGDVFEVRGWLETKLANRR